MADSENTQGAGGAPGGQAVVIIKKKKKGGGHGHHGGAWKVAYADFVTAMMAFFLLLWLLASTTKEQKEGIAHYFNPPNNASEYGGGSGIMGGESAIAKEAHAPKETPALPEKPKQQEDEDLAVQATEDALFKQVAEQMQKAIMNIPQLQLLVQHLLIDVTPEGLRIQITDSRERPLFENGSAVMMPYTKEMLAVIADVLGRLPNGLAVGGHTDVLPYRGERPSYTNWELSSDRAQATRRVLEDEGIPTSRMARVAGYAAQDLLLRDEPQHPKNRRISIIVLRAKKGPVAQFTEQGLTLPIQSGPRVQ